MRKPGLLVLCALLPVLGRAEPSKTVDAKFDALLHQGFALHQESRFADAIPVLEQARRLRPGDYFANLLLGIDLLRSGKAAEAVPRLKLAARARPGEWWRRLHSDAMY